MPQTPTPDQARLPHTTAALFEALRVASAAVSEATVKSLDLEKQLKAQMVYRGIARNFIAQKNAKVATAIQTHQEQVALAETQCSQAILALKAEAHEHLDKMLDNSENIDPSLEQWAAKVDLLKRTRDAKIAATQILISELQTKATWAQESVAPVVQGLDTKIADNKELIQQVHQTLDRALALENQLWVSKCEKSLGVFGGYKLTQKQRTLNQAFLNELFSLDKQGIQRYLRLGADVDASLRNGITPLLKALGTGTNFSTVRWLLEAGAHQKVVTPKGENILHLLVKHWELSTDDSKDLLDKITACESLINARNRQGKTPLRLAVEARDATWVARLIKHGASVDHLYGHDETPPKVDKEINDLLKAAHLKNEQAEDDKPTNTSNFRPR